MKLSFRKTTVLAKLPHAMVSIHRPSGSPPALTLSRWMARVRRSLLESDPEAAEQARREAAKLAPSVMERLFFEAIEAGSLRLKLRAGWSGEWTQARKEGLSTWAEFYRLLEILDAAPSQTPASEQAASTEDDISWDAMGSSAESEA
jgi:hypothetical protein